MTRSSQALPPDDYKYFLTESELAERLNISIRTLQSQRIRGNGIPYVKIGRSVRYQLDVVMEYLNQNTHMLMN